MNKVFKVIWSEARNAYVVVSEIAKNHGSKSCSTKKLLTMLIATGVMTCASMAPALAATNVNSSAKVNVGKKAEVNVKDNAKVNVEEDAVLTVKNGAKVTFDKGAKIGFENSAKVNLGSNAGITLADGVKVSVAKDSNVSVDQNITIGNKANVSVWNSVTGKNISGDIAVGPNAHAWNGEYSYGSEGRIGSKEYYLDFGQGGVVGAEWFPFVGYYKYKVADGSKIAGSIAIGKNTVARTGSVMLGDHSYTGKLGDIEINPEKAMTYNDGIYSTTLGAGAYNSGSLAAVTGALSIASGSDTKNTGATIYGSMNSIESATSDNIYSGVASSVLGFANRTQNANAALIWGTGNEVTNSIEKVGIDTDWNNVSVAEAQKKAIEAMQSKDYAGGSVMAIGGGNKADYAKYSQLTGVKNKVTGTEAKAAKYDFVNGYQNTVTNASDVTVIGIKNEVTADGNKVIGDNQKVSGKYNVIFGSADEITETTVNNAVVLGHNAKVTGEGGVALGAGSVADRNNAVSVGTKDANRQIINVAAGTEDTDAVNVSQLKKATANANKGWKLSTEGRAANQVASEATVDFSGKKDAGDHQNITVSNDGNNVKIDLASELHNVTSVVNGDSRVTLAPSIAGITNGQASVVMLNGSTTINGVVGIDNTGKISGVANGEADKDAVNYGQLKDVKAEALKHSTVTNGDNITVTEGLNKDGGKEYNVALNNDIHLFGDNDAMVSISGSKGTIWTSGSVTAGSVVAGDVVMDSTTATVSGLSNKTIAYEDFATTGKAATEEQLKEVATEAGKHTTLVAGDNVTLDKKETDKGLEYTVNAVDTKYTAGNGIAIDEAANNAISVNLKEGEVNLAVDEKGLSLNKDLKGIESISNGDAKLALNGAAGTAGIINGQGASVYLQDGYTKINNKVIIDQDGKISGVAAGKISADSTDAVNGSQLNAVATEAGKHSKVVNGNNTNVEETTVDGQKVYKVNLNNNIMVGDVTGKYVSISGTNGTIEATGAIATKDRVYADKGAKLADIDVTGDKISNGASSIVLDGSNVKVNDKVTIDQNGNIAGVNSIQTNALNAKYNLSVGTANENGTVPFFVNSNGAFYAANGKLVVDKDGKLVAPEAELGKVTADEGVIGNVVLKDGVFYKNSALRDGELFIGDADGNYSQITTKGAKLGKVTVAADGKISGVAAGAITADSTDAVNGSQLHAVATEAGKHSKVVNGSNINVEETDVDGQKIYKVNLNKDIMLGDLTGKYVSISGTNGTIETTGYIATKDRVYADKGAKLADIDVTGNKISNGASSIVLDGSNVKVNDKVTIDQNGNMAGVNSIQTNALNAKYNLSVGTANADGTMPFFVNSNGAFYAANGKLVVDKDGKLVAPEAELGKVTADEGVIGNVVLKDGVFYKHTALRDGELFVGDADGNYSQITTKGAKLGKVTVAEDGKISGVAAGAVTADSTDAVNGSQLHAVATEAGKHSKVVNGSNINVEEFDNDGQKIYKVNLNKDIILGDLTGKYVNISGTNGTIETTGSIATQDRVYADKGGKLADIDVTGNKISNGASSIVLDGSNVKVNDKVTIDQNGKISGVAEGEVSSTSTDAINGSQLKKTNDRVAANETAIKNNTEAISKLDGRVTANETAIKNNAEAIGSLNTRVDGVEKLAKQHTTVTAGDNIAVTETTNKDGGKEYKVALDKDIKLDSVTTGQTVMNNDGLKVGKDVSVTATAVTAGKTSISDEGVKVGDKTYISDKGLNANDQKVTNVAAGEISATSKDAVNGSQLYATNQEVANNTNRINQLGSRVNKVGAGAAALAALHPMDFDPDDKLTFSAGYGNYGGENAAAIGAYYRPDEKVMFSVGGTVGNGENMVNAGVSFSLDRTNHVSNSRTAMAREILDLRAEVTELKAMVAKGGLGSIAEDKMKIFPDVAENHWAYEYVGKLAAAGIIEGYPDGNFSGDRMMSRYEFAAMLYRAMQKGAQLDSKIINEFAPEMGRIRVDRISGEDGDRDKIERVRVNAVKGERDHYGNKIAKAEAKAK